MVFATGTHARTFIDREDVSFRGSVARSVLQERRGTSRPSRIGPDAGRERTFPETKKMPSSIHGVRVHRFAAARIISPEHAAPCSFAAPGEFGP
jgi:hypothetical protein